MFYAVRMNTNDSVPTWEKTPQHGMVKHKSGGYYARFFLNGKEVWKSLKTKHYSVAKARFAEAENEHRQRRGTIQSASSEKMTFAQAAELHFQNLANKVTIKGSTRKYWKEILAAVLKSWPSLGSMEVRKLTLKACREWAARHATEVSSTRYNNAISLLRHVIAVAAENGVVFNNVAASLDRKTVRAKKLELPSLKKFGEFIAAMRARKFGHAPHCADFAEGMAYTGCRVSEAGRIEWRDLDFTHGEILVKGDPTDATKNGEIRRVPMIPSARALFERMRSQRKDEDGSLPVFKVRECEKAMTRAAKEVQMTRITHHDLRHFFATVCIESGVDIPTVSRWLGHKDGGALAMKTYGHLRREHSQAQAQKVSFAA